MELAGKVAVVAGSGGPAARAVALGLLQAGCRVALAAPEEADPAGTVRGLERDLGVHGLALPFSLDIHSEPQVSRIFRRVSEELGGAEILVAGDCTLPPRVPLVESQAEAYERVTATYLGATYLFCREALRLMIPRRRGHIVVLSSDLAFRARPEFGLAAPARFGQRALAEVLGQEARPYGVRVTGIYPGAVAEAPAAEPGGWGPAGWLQPEDVASAVLYALSQPSHVRVEMVVLRGMGQADG
ncbi:MAG: SDR family oxidoreductase [Firmicutes bacterium]|nr:SDR family oxidoreductase [Bacillota bacterium]